MALSVSFQQLQNSVGLQEEIIIPPIFPSHPWFMAW
jgi:hypothetical protein